jgi:hypothetical protein
VPTLAHLLGSHPPLQPLLPVIVVSIAQGRARGAGGVTTGLAEDARVAKASRARGPRAEGAVGTDAVGTDFCVYQRRRLVGGILRSAAGAITVGRRVGSGVGLAKGARLVGTVVVGVGAGAAVGRFAGHDEDNEGGAGVWAPRPQCMSVEGSVCRARLS